MQRATACRSKLEQTYMERAEGVLSIGRGRNNDAASRSLQSEMTGGLLALGDCADASDKSESRRAR